MTEINRKVIPSPCIGVCSINSDNNLCSGCYRTMDEISAWYSFTLEEKKAVLARIEQRLRDLFS
ncbi:MAG: hypothetical protein RL368_523 [Pseudomonadota bacterium]|jgi:predicted Fe-S protein YdhL (DUF1289 family)